MIDISSRPFGVAAGKEVMKYTLSNPDGMRVAVIGYGCAVQSILVPDRDGVLRDVALGYDTAAFYEQGSSFFGAFVGRYANRIGGARFSLNGKTYRLEKNDANNHLHGTLARRVYDGVIRDDTLVFPFISLPGEEGYPGTLKGEVRYRLTEDNALEIEYTAVSDEDTVINLTNHTYFNLNGQDGSDVLDHLLRINADSFTEINEEKLPTGRVLRVEGTPLDFLREKEIGADIFRDDRQLRLVSGYDHNFVLNGTGGSLREIAVAKSQKTGITMTVFTTEPGVQLYTGNFVHEDAAPCGKGGVHYPRFGGFCLEAQHFPNAVNIPDFPSPILKKGALYHQKTIYRFTA